MTHAIGVDIGGTFTDCVVAQTDGRVTLGKASSTPPDFHTGFIAALQAGAESAGTTLDRLLREASGIYHGCTVGTNALVEGRGARVGLLTTRGHRDAIFMMGGGFRLAGSTADAVARVAYQDKPAPLVPKHLVAEVDERVGVDGAVVVELDEQGARQAIRRLLADGAEAFAVSLLWSTVNPAHEERLAELLAEEGPGAYVSRSSDVIPREGEYERTVATVVNAAIGPVMDAYLAALEHELERLGYREGLRIMSCSGGLVDAAYARRRPVVTVGSGPVAGLIGAGKLLAATGGGVDVITGDVGGTTFDVGVIRDGTPLTRPTSRLGQYAYFVPTLDVRSIGAGGGSIIRYDPHAESLRVGPDSAGARPGPACYGRGGTEPTVTDATLVLGYLDPGTFLGGRMRLDVAAARRALAAAGKPLGFDADETAAAAVRIVDNQMADAIRLASIQQGYDPARHVLYAYGGGGAVHAGALARELGIGRVVVPLGELAAGWSAFGAVAADTLVVEELSLSLPWPFDLDALNDAWRMVQQKVADALDAQGVDPGATAWEREVDVRYAMQVHELAVAAPPAPWDAAAAATVLERFEAEYARLFGPGAGYADAGYTVCAVRVRGRVSASDIVAAAGGEVEPHTEPPASRAVIFYELGLDRVETPVHRGRSLGDRDVVTGPTIVEFADTTLVVRPGQFAYRDAAGSVVLDTRKEEA